MDQEKVHQILNWPPARNLKALQSFLGFANFYRSFIKNYSKKTSSLTSFLKKNLHFPLNEEALKTDASGYTLGAVLSQVSDSGKHPIAFDSCKLLPAELNYEIHDKELLGSVWALKRWRAFLLSLSSSFEVLTDHSSLQYLMSSKILTRCQPTGLNFSLSSIFQSLTALAALLPFQMHCHVGMTFAQRGGRFHQQESNESSKNNQARKLKPQNSLQSRWNHFQI
ncbi:hypothetical protein O181_104704 [Austropuccinia psidii MF-1]|uniref:Reverse transcriptase RNase H-like domain-containing protein n=1 Tax=Austropuccinia psidii MF-1 TaxID=1389203 RepID=A0A9Q3JMY5_9BASI|nr:hypothetical protein [Austropuccinia psidii MF-1]